MYNSIDFLYNFFIFIKKIELCGKQLTILKTMKSLI